MVGEDAVGWTGELGGGCGSVRGGAAGNPTEAPPLSDSPVHASPRAHAAYPSSLHQCSRHAAGCDHDGGVAWGGHGLADWGRTGYLGQGGGGGGGGGGARWRADAQEDRICPG